MEYHEARRRILYHANLEEPGGEDWLSYLDALLQVEGKALIADVQQETDDLIDCLEVVNHHWNGAVPSVQTGTLNQLVEGEVAYAVANILSGGTEHLVLGLKELQGLRADFELFGEQLWCISSAWGAVLAGDIDSIADFLEEEGKARGISDVSLWRRAARARRGIG